jgi:hypothetical protein
LLESPSEFDEDDRGDRLTSARSILTPEVAWKINQATAPSEIEAENAMGDVRKFETATKVVELPRSGWDRLSARVRGEP